jgi:glutamate synthase domain-containing protein 3
MELETENRKPATGNWGVMDMLRIDAQGMHYRELNRRVRTAAAAGERELVLDNINGQRYIGTGLETGIRITINGVPGNDLAAFMNGPAISVYGNAQDGVANTMSGGTVVVDGDAGDVLGYGMRGGKLFIRGDVGYRVGIHMKQYRELVPVLVVGGVAGAFFGEYMAGGRLVLLGLDRPAGCPLAGDYLGTGMHGGVIYLRGRPEERTLGREVKLFELDEADWAFLEVILAEFCRYYDRDCAQFRAADFCKLIPVSHRPYGCLYTPQA